MTGIELNEKLALFYAEYKATDHLLCHDDELEGRRIAFILYLSPQWSEEDGGTLDLFSVDDQVKRKIFFFAQIYYGKTSFVPIWKLYSKNTILYKNEKI